MEAFIFMFFYVGVLASIILFVKKAGINIFKISIPMIIFWSVLVFAYIGFPFIVFKQVPLYVNQGVTNDKTLWKSFFLSSFVWLQFFAGFFIGGRMFGISKKRITINYNQKDNKISTSLFYILLTLSIGIFIIYLGKVQHIAVLEAIKGTNRFLIAYYRSEMTNNFPNYHRFALFFNTIIPYLSYIAWAEFLITKRKKWRNLFILVFVVSSFALVMDTQKAPIIWYLAALASIFWVVKDFKINPKAIFKIGSVFMIVLMMMYSFFMGADLNINTLKNPIQRAFTGQLAPLYWYLEIYPDQIEFIGGKTFPNPGGILPWESYRYTVEVSNYVREFNNDVRLDNIVGSSPTAFFGELWVNFGIWLNILLPLYLGIVIIIIHKQFIKRPIGALGVSLMVWLAFHLRELATTGISKYLFDLELYVILIISYLFIQLPKLRSRQ